MLLSVILYGSRARGDYRPKSDFDLLGVIENGPMRREIAAGGVSLYHYPVHKLQSAAEIGELFALHLTAEGKVLHDTLGVFKNVQASFSFKSNYDSEIEDASYVIRFLIDRRNLIAKKDVRKRLVWAMRTILIARNANERRVCFSSALLANYSRIGELKDIIDHRNLPDTEGFLKVATRVLERFGNGEWLANWPDEKAAQREILEARGGVAADTIRFVRPFAILKKTKSPTASLSIPDIGFAYPD